VQFLEAKLAARKAPLTWPKDKVFGPDHDARAVTAPNYCSRLRWRRAGSRLPHLSLLSRPTARTAKPRTASTELPLAETFKIAPEHVKAKPQLCGRIAEGRSSKWTSRPTAFG